jgi:hypothetical protein
VVPSIAFFSINIPVRRGPQVYFASKSWRLDRTGNLLLTLHSISIDLIFPTIQRHLFERIDNLFGNCYSFLPNVKLCLRKNTKQNFLFPRMGNRELT